MAELEKVIIESLERAKYEDLNPDNLYNIKDYPVVGITNAQMAMALSPDFNEFFIVGDVFICVDSGTYTKGRAYRFTGTAWELVTEFDSSPTENSVKPVTSGGVYTALSGKQGTLTFDTTPTTNSTNPVTSGGVKSYVDEIVGNINTILESVL